MVNTIHHSIRQSTKGKIKPNNMSKAPAMDEETRDGLSNIALSIFTDSVNSGQYFQDAILAVYLSGLENGVSALNDKGSI